MIEQDTSARLREKIEDGSFGMADLPEYLALFCETATATEDIQDEVDGWNRRIHLALEGCDDAWVAVSGGRFTAGAGAPEQPDLTLRMTGMEAARIFAGEKDAKASYLAGALKVEGPLPDAVRFQTIVGLVIEALDL